MAAICQATRRSYSGFRVEERIRMDEARRYDAELRALQARQRRETGRLTREADRLAREVDRMERKLVWQEEQITDLLAQQQEEREYEKLLDTAQRMMDNVVRSNLRTRVRELMAARARQSLPATSEPVRQRVVGVLPPARAVDVPDFSVVVPGEFVVRRVR